MLFLILFDNVPIVEIKEDFMDWRGWVAGLIIVLGVYLTGDKSILGFVCAIVGNAIWVYIGIKRNKQYDLATLAFVLVLMNLRGLILWLGWI